MDVYIEYVILDNLIIDYLLIKTSLFAVKIKSTTLRIFLSSLYATTFAVLLPLANLSTFSTFGIKIACAFTTVVLSAKFTDLKKYLFALGIFLLLTFISGGLLIAIFNALGIDYLDENVWNYNSPLPVGITVLAVYITLKYVKMLITVIYKKKAVFPFLKDCEISLGGKTVKAKGFLDSGNCLFDKKTGEPIIIISKRILLYMLKLGALSKVKGKTIYFNTVSGKDKMTVFKVDNFKILEGTTDKVFNGVSVGICPSKLGNGKDYDLIFGSYFV